MRGALLSVFVFACSHPAADKTTTTTPKRHAKLPVKHGEVTKQPYTPPSGETVEGEPHGDAPPVPIPKANKDGCVAADVAAELTAKLDAWNEQSWHKVLEDGGYQLTKRDAFGVRENSFEDASEPDPSLLSVGSMDGMGMLAGHSVEAHVAVKDKTVYYPDIGYPRAHVVTLRICGVRPCVYGRGAMVDVVRLFTRVAKDERVGGQLRVIYDVWRVDAHYESQQDCGDPPP